MCKLYFRIIPHGEKGKEFIHWFPCPFVKRSPLVSCEGVGMGAHCNVHLEGPGQEAKPCQAVTWVTLLWALQTWSKRR